MRQINDALQNLISLKGKKSFSLFATIYSAYIQHHKCNVLHKDNKKFDFKYTNSSV